MPQWGKGMQGIINGWVSKNNKHVVFPGEHGDADTTNVHTNEYSQNQIQTNQAQNQIQFGGGGSGQQSVAGPLSSNFAPTIGNGQAILAQRHSRRKDTHTGGGGGGGGGGVGSVVQNNAKPSTSNVHTHRSTHKSVRRVLQKTNSHSDLLKLSAAKKQQQQKNSQRQRQRSRYGSEVNSNSNASRETSTSGDTKSSALTAQIDNSSQMRDVYPQPQPPPSSTATYFTTTPMADPQMAVTTGQYVNEAAFSNRHKNQQQFHQPSTISPSASTAPIDTSHDSKLISHNQNYPYPDTYKQTPDQQKGKGKRKSVMRPKQSFQKHNHGKKKNESVEGPKNSDKSPRTGPQVQVQMPSPLTTFNKDVPIANTAAHTNRSHPRFIEEPILEQQLQPQNIHIPQQHIHKPSPQYDSRQSPYKPEQELSADCPCIKCKQTEQRLIELQVDVEYLRSMAMQNEFVCAECETTSGSIATQLPNVSSNVSLTSGRHSVGSRRSRRSRRSSRGRDRHANPLDMFKNHESVALSEASQRLIDVSSRHKQQIENMTKKTAKWQNDTHLKLSKLSLMCRSLNEESAKRKEEANNATTELENLRSEQNAMSSELEILRARVQLYETQEMENSDIRTILREQENETLNAADEVISERDKIIASLTDQLRQTKDTLEFERKLQNQRRQIIFPLRKTTSLNSTDKLFFSGESATKEDATTTTATTTATTEIDTVI